MRAAGTRMWAVQRITAAFLGLAVIVHLVTIMLAIRGGLSAAEILARTRGAELWFGFYVLFALCAGLHGAIGLRNIAGEWLGLRGRTVDALWMGVGLATAAFGIRAAWGLYHA
ncbi:succinate dehydrogenase [Roseococcus sp. SDR]|nr:succinate dehydrogenase [Roseococcus sp. SDR]MBV1847341.1 succinate dehydrogenase [Roseococcus sp. SDR]